MGGHAAHELVSLLLGCVFSFNRGFHWAYVFSDTYFKHSECSERSSIKKGIRLALYCVSSGVNEGSDAECLTAVCLS